MFKFWEQAIANLSHTGIVALAFALLGLLLQRLLAVLDCLYALCLGFLLLPLLAHGGFLALEGIYLAREFLQFGGVLLALDGLALNLQLTQAAR